MAKYALTMSFVTVRDINVEMDEKEMRYLQKHGNYIFQQQPRSDYEKALYEKILFAVHEQLDNTPLGELSADDLMCTNSDDESMNIASKQFGYIGEVGPDGFYTFVDEAESWDSDEA